MSYSPTCWTPLGLANYLFAQSQLSRECSAAMNSPARFVTVPLAQYASVFALTCLLESPFYAWGFGLLMPSRSSALRRDLMKSKRASVHYSTSALILSNLATHPIVFFGFPWVMSRFHASYGQMLLGAETFAPVVEWLLLWRFFGMKASRAAIVSITANPFSWWVGALLT